MKSIKKILCCLLLTACTRSPIEAAADRNSCTQIEATADRNAHGSYRQIETLAKTSVDQKAATAALAGDAQTALEIGHKFATENKFEEARYWFSIAAENGSPIGMQNLSATIRKTDCQRANYWLRRYLSHDDDVIGKDDRVLYEKSLHVYELSCQAKQKATE